MKNAMTHTARSNPAAPALPTGQAVSDAERVANDYRPQPTPVAEGIR